MNKSRAADIRVGIFVLAAIAILAIGLLWIAGSNVFGVKRQPYRVLLTDSGGLQPGDRVRVAGVAVGQIQGVELRPGETYPVVLRVRIKSNVSIGVDASARVATSGLLGASYLELDTGSGEAERLVAGGEIVGTTSTGVERALSRVDEIAERVITLLDRTTAALDTLSGDLEPMLSRLDSVLSAGNVADIKEILTNLRLVTGDAAPRVGSLLDRLESAATAVDGGADGLPELMAEIRALVEDARQVVGPEGSRLIGLVETTERSLESADRTLSALGDNRTEIDQTLADLRDAVSNLKAFSQQIKERPFSVLRIKPEPRRNPGDGAKESDR